MKKKFIFSGASVLLLAAFFFFMPKGVEKGQCLEGDCINGPGTLVFKDGSSGIRAPNCWKGEKLVRVDQQLLVLPKRF